MPESFLISRLSALGDVVCSLPAAGALRTAFPEAKIVWAVDPRFAGVVRACTFVSEVVEVKPGLTPPTWPQIEGEYDAALDLQGLFKSGIVVGKAKAKLKAGYHWQREFSWLFSRHVTPDPTSYHIVDQYVDVARAVGGKMDRAEFGLRPDPQALTSIQQKLGITERFVAMNPGAGWASKRWPAPAFAQVIDGLAERGIRTVLLGGRGPADRESADDVIQACESRPIDLTGQTSIPELVALLSLASAHLGGDTGSTHLSAALGKPAVGLYSITRPERSCPYGQIHRCHYRPDGLTYIAPQAVLHTLLEALET